MAAILLGMPSASWETVPAVRLGAIQHLRSYTARTARDDALAGYEEYKAGHRKYMAKLGAI